METCKCISRGYKNAIKRKIKIIKGRIITGEKVGTDVRVDLTALKRNKNRKQLLKIM